MRHQGEGRWVLLAAATLASLAFAGACSAEGGEGGASAGAAGEQAGAGSSPRAGASAQGGAAQAGDGAAGGRDAGASGGPNEIAGAAGDTSASGGAAGAGASNACFVAGDCESGQQCQGSQPTKVCVAQDEYCGTSPLDCGRRAVCVDHRCQAPLEQGTSCDSSAECVLGTSCQAVSVGWQCQPSYAEGQVCDLGFDNSSGQPVPVEGKGDHCPAEAPCEVSDQIGDDTWYCIGTRDTRGCMYGCAPTSFCAYQGMSDAHCEARHAQKDDCFYDGDCQAGLSCGAGYDSQGIWTYALCVPSPALGESCQFPEVIDQPDLGMLTVTCESGAYCADDGICHAAPKHGQTCGQPVLPTYGSGPFATYVECSPGLKCVDSWSDGACQ